MDLRFYRDPLTGVAHVRNHAVSEEEARDVMDAPLEDRPGRDGSRVAIGRTASGRYLRVIYVPDEGLTSAFVVTAYELCGKPLWAFRRRRRKKGKR
jgi:hypothetical protein